MQNVEPIQLAVLDLSTVDAVVTTVGGTNNFLATEA